MTVFVERNEIFHLAESVGGEEGRFVVRRGIFGGAPFFLGEEASVEIFEGGEFVGEFGNRHTAAKRVIDAGFDEGEDGAAECAGMSLAGELDGAGALAEEMGGAGVLVVAGVEPDEGAVAGLELETFGSGFGKDFESLVVSVLIAEFDHALLVLGREVSEFGTRFAEFCRSVQNVHGDVPFLSGGSAAASRHPGWAGRLGYTSFVKGSAEVCGHRQGGQRRPVGLRACVLRTQGGKTSGFRRVRFRLKIRLSEVQCESAYRKTAATVSIEELFSALNGVCQPVFFRREASELTRSFSSNLALNSPFSSDAARNYQQRFPASGHGHCHGTESHLADGL
jgi:hypothetical protein